MSCIAKRKVEMRARRRKSVRLRLRGTSERPRICVFRSNSHMYVQLIDDSKGTTLLSLSTLHKSVADGIVGKKPVEKAKALGVAFGKLCLENNYLKLSFDRNGFFYHGRVKAVADGVREAGLDL